MNSAEAHRGMLMAPTLTCKVCGLWEELDDEIFILIPDATHSHSHGAMGLAKYSVTKETQVVSPEPYGINGDLFRKSEVCHFKLTATKLLFDYLPPYCIVLSQ